MASLLVISVPNKFCKRTVLVQVIVEDVVTCFFGTQNLCEWICNVHVLPFYLQQKRRYMVSPTFVCLSVCVQDYSKRCAWIWMKCCLSTDVGTWTNWLTFEPDPDHSPDPGTGFTPDFLILARYLNKLWTDFDETLYVDSCGGLHDLVRFWAGSGSEFGSWNRIYTGFLNFSGYLKTLRTDFDDGGLDELIRFWAGSGS